MKRRSGQKGGETEKPVEFCDNRRVLKEPSSSARLIEFCEIDQVSLPVKIVL